MQDAPPKTLPLRRWCKSMAFWCSISWSWHWLTARCGGSPPAWLAKPATSTTSYARRKNLVVLRFFFGGRNFQIHWAPWLVDQCELAIPGPGILDSWVEVSSLAASGCSCCGQFEAGLGARRETKKRRLDRKEKSRKWKTDQGGVEPPKRAVKANQGFAWSYATPIGQLVLCKPEHYNVFFLRGAIFPIRLWENSRAILSGRPMVIAGGW